MDRVMFSAGFLRKKLLFALLVNIFLLLAPIASAEWELSQSDKQTIVRQVAGDWMDVAEKQYERAYFAAAKKSLLQAQEYHEYLTDTEWARFSELLLTISKATTERERILQLLREIDELIKQDKLLKAKVNLITLENSRYLTQKERNLITQSLFNVDQRLDEQKKQIAAIYKRSVLLFDAGYLEKARIGFIEVARSGLLATPLGKTAEDYLVKIDNLLRTNTEQSLISTVYPQIKKVEITAADIENQLLAEQREPEIAVQINKEQIKEPFFIPVAEASKDKDVKPGPQQRRAKLRRSYARAVVSDSVEKAKTYVEQGRFYKAKIAAAGASSVVIENKQYLSEKLYMQYQEELKQLQEEINKGRTKWLGQTNK